MIYLNVISHSKKKKKKKKTVQKFKVFNTATSIRSKISNVFKLYRLQFTKKVGGNELSFADLKLILKDNKIQTMVYSKPIDSHLYLNQFLLTFTFCFRNPDRI